MTERADSCVCAYEWELLVRKADRTYSVPKIRSANRLLWKKTLDEPYADKIDLDVDGEGLLESF